MTNPVLPIETANFSEATIERKQGISLDQYEQLHKMELRDVNQQITMRPIVAAFFALLLIAQNVVVFMLVWWALDTDRLGQLQWIFGTLIAASLLETYKISNLIVNKLFEPIDYADKHKRFQ